MVLDDGDLGMGMRKNAGVGELLQGGGICGYSIWVGDVVDDPPHGPETGGGFSIGWIDRSQDGKLGGILTEDGSRPPWRSRREIQSWRRSMYTS